MRGQAVHHPHIDFSHGQIDVFHLRERRTDSLAETKDEGAGSGGMRRYRLKGAVLLASGSRSLCSGSAFQAVNRMSQEDRTRAATPSAMNSADHSVERRQNRREPLAHDVGGVGGLRRHHGAVALPVVLWVGRRVSRVGTVHHSSGRYSHDEACSVVSPLES